MLLTDKQLATVSGWLTNLVTLAKVINTGKGEAVKLHRTQFTAFAQKIVGLEQIANLKVKLSSFSIIAQADKRERQTISSMVSMARKIGAELAKREKLVTDDYGTIVAEDVFAAWVNDEDAPSVWNLRPLLIAKTQTGINRKAVVAFLATYEDYDSLLEEVAKLRRFNEARQAKLATLNV